MAAAAEGPSVQKRSAWLWVQHLFVRLGVLPFLLIIAVVVFALMSDRFLGLDPKALAGWMLEDLERGGAIRIAGGVARPAMAA